MAKFFIICGLLLLGLMVGIRATRDTEPTVPLTPPPAQDPQPAESSPPPAAPEDGAAPIPTPESELPPARPTVEIRGGVLTITGDPGEGETTNLNLPNAPSAAAVPAAPGEARVERSAPAGSSPAATPKPVTTSSHDVYGSPAPSTPPLPPGTSAAPAAPAAPDPVMQPEPAPPSGVETPPDETGRYGQYDESGEYLEPAGEIDYGEWDEGAQAPAAPDPKRDDPAYQRWERAQKSWNQVGQ